MNLLKPISTDPGCGPSGQIDCSRKARCPACKLPRTICACAELPRVTLPVRFVFLRHVCERRRQSNTGDLAQRMFVDSALLEYGVKNAAIDRTELVGPPGASFVLFPIPGAPELTRELLEKAGEPHGGAEPTLILLDAPWASARRMLTRCDALRGVPVVQLPAGPAADHVLRRPPELGQYFTLEAAVRAVEALGFSEEAARLRAATSLLVRRMLFTRGRLSREAAFATPLGS